MNEVLAQGLTLTILGMGLVFLALGALWLIMWALGYMFRAREPQPVAGNMPSPETTGPSEAEVAAIIGALLTTGLLPGINSTTGKKNLGQALGQASTWRSTRRQLLTTRRTYR